VKLRIEDMKKTPFLIRILLTCALLLQCGYGALPCHAEEQYIAESFGLYSKGVEYYHTGKLHEAKEILERAVKFDSRNDEAQTYLDLVNAELKMRARGRLNSYKRVAEIERESDPVAREFTLSKESLTPGDSFTPGEYTDNPE